MTLNLWRYHDWDNRIDSIVSLIRDEQPDIIAFQEVMTNHAFSDFPATDVIADSCGYAYRSFAPTLARHATRDRDGNHTQLASEGQAVISKYPIIRTESYFLTYRTDYPEEKAILICDINVDGQIFELCNIHLANSKVAYPQLEQVLELMETRRSKPIILGDFNIYKLADYKSRSRLLNDYTISSELADYVSYPGDDDSLDYIAVPKSTYTLRHIWCPDKYVSDHRAVIGDISIDR